MNGQPVRRVMIVKLGDFSSFVLAFGAFNAIRRHHTNAHITLLTTKAFGELARKSGWFDEIWDDGDLKPTRLARTVKLIRRLRRSGMDKVFDLDNSKQSARLRFWMRDFWGNKADWSRSNPGFLSFGRSNDNVPEHYVEQLLQQLGQAGIQDIPSPDLSWLTTGFGGRYGLKDGFVMIVPGHASEDTKRRWATDRFVELARRVAIEGRTPVVIGEHAEARTNQMVAAASPEAMDLTEKTTLFDVAALATRAGVAIGHNTGVMQLIAAAGCPSVILSPTDADAARYAPRGRYVVMIRSENMADLSVSEVAASLRLG